jgi:hypothetical protein
MLRSHLIKHRFMEDYRYWNKHGEERLNEAEMRDSYLEREVSTDVEDHDDDVNEPDILGFIDDDIEFQMHNVEEMVRNVERHGDNDQYSNGELAKYKKNDQRLEEAIVSWLRGSIHEIACDSETFPVEGGQWME